MAVARADNTDYLAAACTKCRKKIASGVKFRKTGGKFYHMECFQCTKCKCVLPEVFVID